MKTWLLLMTIGIVVLLMPACIPTDEVTPDDPVAKFLGEWKVIESCNRGNFTVKIVQDPGNSAQVLLENFGNTGPGYDAAVGLVVTNSIIISSQTIGEGWTVSGTGVYQSNGTILWDYSLFIPPNEENCSATFSR